MAADEVNLAPHWAELTRDEKDWLIVVLNHARKFPRNHLCCKDLPEVWEGILPFVSWNTIKYVISTIHVDKPSIPEDKRDPWVRHYYSHRSLLDKWKIEPNHEVKREYEL